MATTPASLPENESMDPVGEPYPNQGPYDPGVGDDPPHPENSPFSEPDIPLDEESDRVVRPD